MELTLDQALKKGIEAHKAGKLQEADRYYTAILKANPKHPDANHNMGVLAVGIRKVEEALPFFKTALESNPGITQFWLSYIDALIKLNRMDDAKAIFYEARSKSIKGDGFEQIEKRLIELEREIEDNAVSRKSEEPAKETSQNLINLYRQGQFQKALIQSSQLLKDFPNSINLYNIIGASNKGLGKLAETIEAYTKVISLKPDYAEAYYNMGVALTGIIFKKPNRGLQNTINSLLDQKRYVRPKDIAMAVKSLLKLEPSLQKHLKLVNSNQLIQNPLDIISDLDELPLLRKLMSVCPLPDLELEKLFKYLRAVILENISSFKEASPELLRFQSALALQCFTNEYVYSQSQNEEKAINVLEKHMKELLSNNEQPSPLAILILASYKALHKYDWCLSLIVTNPIQEVFTRQVEEPLQEEKLKLNIPILEEISNKVSSNVREQYEESPYPRWVNLGLNLEPAPISKVVDDIKLKLHDNKITKAKNPDILIAGCGTGQHSITTAARFKSSKVLAIDLSLSSLAYAKRKTEELAIENIEYMQADILDLGKLNKQFDIIESGGVLHHMDNPMKGWEVLTDCLKPGGLMKIGLYSELARNHIVKIREEISQLGIGSSSSEMKYFRDMIIVSDKSYYKKIINYDDFYNLSELKDLLFHVQEHRFTIPLIKNHLKKLGLKFCGFETSKVQQFKLANKYDKDLYDLDKWQVFEEANPEAFAGMYQFWCQKDL